MVELDKARQILEHEGYAYEFSYCIYYSQRTKKVFDEAFVEDLSETELQRCLRERVRSEELRFYFDPLPTEAFKKKIEDFLARKAGSS